MKLRLHMKPSGQALLTILFIGATIAVAIGLGLSWGSRPLVSQNRQAIRSNLLAFKKSLLGSVNCSQSIAGITPSTSCRTTPLGQPGAVIELKDSTGANLTTGGVRGRYRIETRCREKLNSGAATGNFFLQVSVEVRDAAGKVMTYPVSFGQMPVSLDFNGPLAGLFTEADSLCAAELGSSVAVSSGSGFQTVSAPLFRGATTPTQPQTTSGCSSNGRPNGTGDCILGTLIGHNFTLPAISADQYNYFRTDQCDLGCGGRRERAIYGFRWLGQANCPAGYKAVSGGANCRALGGFSHLQNGLQIASHPLPDGSGWITACCGGNRSSIGAGGAHPTERAWVTCVKETGP